MLSPIRAVMLSLRCLLLRVSLLCVLPGFGLTAAAWAQPVVETLTDPFRGSGGVVLHPEGHALYVGNFGDAFGQNPDNWGRDVKVVALPGGDVETFATGFIIASGNDFAADGDTLLQVELGRGYVWKVAPDGSTRRWATGFASPVGIAATPDGGAFVAECGGNRVSRVEPDGTRLPFAESAEFNCPNGLARAPDGTLYAVNFTDGKILRIDGDANVSVLATGPGGGNGHVRYAAGRLFVADRSGHQILGVSLEGELEVIAGSGAPGNEDGPASEASFRLPNGVAVTPDGSTIYVSSKVSEDPAELNPVVIRVIRGLPVAGEGAPEPDGPGLLPVAPNPSHGGTTIRYRLAAPSPVELAVYSVEGRRVAVLDAAVRGAGEHAVRWDGTDGAGRAVAAGVYLCRLRTDGGVETQQVTLLR